MTEQQMIEKIKQTKIVPVVVLNSIEETLFAIAAIASVGVTMPGRYSIPCFLQQSATSSENPGETINLEPAAIAFSHCSLFITIEISGLN